MLAGIGTDILKISQIAASVGDPEDSFVRRTFTQRERALILSRPIPLNSYATRFAGKEAVFKSMQADGDAFRLSDIEILEDANGAPTVTLYGKAKALAEKKGILRIHISLSYDTDYAIAFAAAERE